MRVEDACKLAPGRTVTPLHARLGLGRRDVDHRHQSTASPALISLLVRLTMSFDLVRIPREAMPTGTESQSSGAIRRIGGRDAGQ